VSNWLVAIVGGAIATIVGGVVLFYVLPSQPTPAISSIAVGPSGPKHLECMMKGGFIDGRATFTLDLAKKKAEWQGLPLEIRRVTEQHVSASTGFHFAGDKYPPTMEWSLCSTGSL
jgi:hypothetical protein